MSEIERYYPTLYTLRLQLFNWGSSTGLAPIPDFVDSDRLYSPIQLLSLSMEYLPEPHSYINEAKRNVPDRHHKDRYINYINDFPIAMRALRLGPLLVNTLFGQLCFVVAVLIAAAQFGFNSETLQC